MGGKLGARKYIKHDETIRIKAYRTHVIWDLYPGFNQQTCTLRLGKGSGAGGVGGAGETERNSHRGCPRVREVGRSWHLCCHGSSGIMAEIWGPRSISAQILIGCAALDTRLL